MNYIILSEKKWHDILIKQLTEKCTRHNFFRISNKADFNQKVLDEIKPNKIFIPHWSYIIPADIYLKYDCIVFHMTDLPFGRGGSPLQNLIVKGYTETVLSAIKVVKEIDAGPIYLKEPLDLKGTAYEIYLKAGKTIQRMIIEIIDKNPEPIEQNGQVTYFDRRTPEQSNISDLENINKVYDFIRMLDCEGYPFAYLETDHFKFEFTNANLSDNKIDANVRITRKK